MSDSDKKPGGALIPPEYVEGVIELLRSKGGVHVMTERTEVDDDSLDWSKLCWAKRFRGQACKRPAKWRGPGNRGTFDRAWRACDEHRMESDVPIAGEAEDS